MGEPASSSLSRLGIVNALNLHASFVQRLVCRLAVGPPHAHTDTAIGAEWPLGLNLDALSFHHLTDDPARMIGLVEKLGERF